MPTPYRPGSGSVRAKAVREQLVGQCGEDARSVAGVGLAADAAAMLHAAIDALGVVHDAAPGASLDVAHEADTAALVFEAGVESPWAGVVSRTRDATALPA